jgi:hypothetical protein
MRFHDLRHSAATLLLELGIHPKVVSKMLGHSQIDITLDPYSHVTATMQQQAVAALDDLFRELCGRLAVNLAVNRGRREQTVASARSSVERAADF